MRGPWDRDAGFVTVVDAIGAALETGAPLVR